MTEPEATSKTIEAVWRIESAKLIARLSRMTTDVGLAEDLAQDAFLSALEQWPRSGVPDNPGAWLMAAARNRAVDQLRRRENFQRKQPQIVSEIEDSRESADIHERLDDDVGDDLLRLIFTACHPVLSTEARTALTLRLLGGLTTSQIARAYVTAESTIAQRIVRAKRTLSAANVRFELPAPGERAERLDSVLEVIYLIFNEGYSATEGDQLYRAELCDEALRLGRVLAGVAPQESEVHGLLALMEIQASRLRARLDSSGRAVRLMDQDRSRWDRVLINRGLLALQRATSLGAPLGEYALQAAIAACHARAAEPSQTDWQQIVALYDALAQVSPSPIVELNRAVAISMAFGPEAALGIVEELAVAGRLEDYHLLHAVRGDLLQRLGRFNEAREAFERAAALTRNDRERDVLLDRAKAER